MNLDIQIIEENPLYLSSQLITYIGNKRGLLPLIENGVVSVKEKLGKKRVTFLDLFSGSGVVSRLMKAHSDIIYCNDLEDYARVVNECYLFNRSLFNSEEYEDNLADINKKIDTDWRRGFIAELYAPKDDYCIKEGERVFYTRRNAEYIDTVRQHIDSIPEHLKKFFLAPLIAKASVHNNTAGVFKGFYKNRKGIGAFGGEAANALNRILGNIYIERPVLSNFMCDFIVTQKDAVAFSSEYQNEFDLVYMDPPYNQHPYGSNYFMLNLISNYIEPYTYSKVSGIPDNWNRSTFNKSYSAKNDLFSIIRNLNAKFFLISYNSEGFIKKEEFIDGLQKIGRLKIVESQYNTYRASRNLSSREKYVTEYLFLLEK